MDLPAKRPECHLNVYPDMSQEEIQHTLDIAAAAAQNDPALLVSVIYAPGRYDLGDGRWMAAGEDAAMTMEIRT